MPGQKPAVVRVLPGRVATLATSVGLTLTAGVASLLGVLPAASATVSEPAAGWPAMDLQGLVSEVPAGIDGGYGVDPPAPGDGPDRPDRADRADRVLPAGSGAGRRVVFDESAQRVWLVRDGGSVLATYAVSGSVHDNLSPGSYEVYSRSLHATAFDYGSTMDYMVRFTQGDSAAIGFHDIPVDSGGEPLQRAAQLGTPTSSGCIRQRPRDAREMWRFAPVGTPVVVVA
ncbi:MAG: L,D-transpeptidase [Nocardioidaceae bacterium]|nr:L,D-transpeptidase [Nocardioidaceae bacterium]